MAARLSTVARGRAFEERCVKLLQSTLSMSLQRVGGPSDGGIDLQGYWWLPPKRGGVQAVASSTSGTPRRLRVLAQCKAERAKLSTVYVREMEGVVYRLLHEARRTASSSIVQDNQGLDEDIPMIALLASESRFTKPTLLRAHSSSIPFLLLHLPPSTSPPSSASASTGDETPAHSATDVLGSAFWNSALGGHSGVLQGEFDLRWERSGGSSVGRPGLWRDGTRLENHTPVEEMPRENPAKEICHALEDRRLA